VKIHHLNCGSFCPLVPVLSEITHCHCLLIETKEGLVLIDTGMSKTHDNLVLKGYEKAAGVDYSRFSTAKENLIAKGFKVSDVRHILITHLDFDHAGGLLDFPEATLHIYQKEWESANKAGIHMLRYQKALWKNHKKVISYTDNGENWEGLNAIKPMEDIDDSILMIPLIGHTFGHAGFALNTDSDKWLFHVGDAYYNQLEFSGGIRSLPYKTLARLSAMDNTKRLENLERIKNLKNTEGLQVCNSHDPLDFEKFL